MALIKCPECLKEISNKAISCPYCGYPLDASIQEGFLTEQSDDGKIILKKYIGKSKNVIIPDGIESIGENCFKDNTNIISVAFPHSCKEIHFDAFRSCINLETIIFNDELEEIQTFAFRNCNNLKKVSLPNRLQHLGSGVFFECEQITHLSIPESVINLGAYFSRMFSLKEINIPKNVKELTNALNYYVSNKSYSVDKIFFNAPNVKIFYLDEFEHTGSFFPSLSVKEFKVGPSVKTFSSEIITYLRIQKLIIPSNVKRLTAYCLSGIVDRLIIEKGVQSIDADFFNDVSKIVYKGSIEDWKKIKICKQKEYKIIQVKCDDGVFKFVVGHLNY